MSCGKRVKLRLVGLDGNSFNLMGQFIKQAKKEGWSKEERDHVIDECQTSDYDHLVYILDNHCEEPDEN